MNLLRRYQGIFYPIIGIMAVLMVLSLLSRIVHLDDASLPRPSLTILPEYPDGITLAQAVLITEAGMWWLLLSLIFWLAGLFAVGFGWYQLHSATRHQAKAHGAVRLLYFAVLGFTLAVLFYISQVKGTPLMSFEFVLRNLAHISDGIVDLTTANTALGIVAVIMMLLSASLLLLPGAFDNDPARQMRAITQIMYCGAAFMLVWVATATEMYRFAAMMLVAEEREEILKLAPTISLTVGVFSSLLLAVAYLASYLWLQQCHRRSRLIAAAADTGQAGPSPRDFLLAHWPKVMALLMPMLPGAVGSVLGVFAQPV